MNKTNQVEQVVKANLNYIVQLVEDQDFHALDNWLGDILRSHYMSKGAYEMQAIYNQQFKKED